MTEENKRETIKRGDADISINRITDIAANDFNLYFARSEFTDEQKQEIANEVNTILAGLADGSIEYNHGARGGFKGLNGITNKKDLKKGQIDTTGYAAGFVGNIIRAAEAYEKPKYEYKEGQYEYNTENLNNYIYNKLNGNVGFQYLSDEQKLIELDNIINDINTRMHGDTDYTIFPTITDSQKLDWNDKYLNYTNWSKWAKESGTKNIFDKEELYKFLDIFNIKDADSLFGFRQVGETSSDTSDSDNVSIETSPSENTEPVNYWNDYTIEGNSMTGFNPIDVGLLFGTKDFQGLTKAFKNASTENLIMLLEYGSTKSKQGKDLLKSIARNAKITGETYNNSKLTNGVIMYLLGQELSKRKDFTDFTTNNSGQSVYNIPLTKTPGNTGKFYFDGKNFNFRVHKSSSPSYKEGGTIRKFATGGLAEMAFYANKDLNKHTYDRLQAILNNGIYEWSVRPSTSVSQSTNGYQYEYSPIDKTLWDYESWKQWENDLTNNENLAREWATSYLNHVSKEAKNGEQSPYDYYNKKWFGTGKFDYDAFKNTLNAEGKNLWNDTKLGPGHDKFAKSVYYTEDENGNKKYYNANYLDDDKDLVEEGDDWKLLDGVWHKKLIKKNSEDPLSQALAKVGLKWENGELVSIPTVEKTPPGGPVGFTPEKHPSLSLFDFNEVKKPGYDWVSDALDISRLGLDLYGNRKSEKILLEGSPSLLEPKERRYGVYGDFGARNYYDNLANKTLLLANMSQTSDASLNKAANMDAFSRSLDLRLKGFQEDNKRIAETMDKSIMANWWSHENKVDTANQNRDRLFNWNEQRRQIRAAHNQAMFNSLSEYLLGIANRNRVNWREKAEKEYQLNKEIGLEQIKKNFDTLTKDAQDAYNAYYKQNNGDMSGWKYYNDYKSLMKAANAIKTDWILELTSRLSGGKYSSKYTPEYLKDWKWVNSPTTVADYYDSYIMGS